MAERAKKRRRYVMRNDDSEDDDDRMDVDKMTVADLANEIGMLPNEMVDVITVLMLNPKLRQQMRITSKEEFSRKYNQDINVANARLTGKSDPAAQQLVFDGLFSQFFDIPAGPELEKFLWSRFNVSAADPTTQMMLYLKTHREMETLLEAGINLCLVNTPRGYGISTYGFIHRRDLFSLFGFGNVHSKGFHSELPDFIDDDESTIRSPLINFCDVGYWQEDVPEPVVWSIRRDLDPNNQAPLGSYETLRVRGVHPGRLARDQMFDFLSDYCDMALRLALAVYASIGNAGANKNAEAVLTIGPSTSGRSLTFPPPPPLEAIRELARELDPKQEHRFPELFKAASIEAERYSFTTPDETNPKPKPHDAVMTISRTLQRWMSNPAFTGALAKIVRQLQLRDILNPDEEGVQNAEQRLTEEEERYGNDIVYVSRIIDDEWRPEWTLTTPHGLTMGRFLLRIPQLITKNLEALVLMCEIMYRVTGRFRRVHLSNDKAPVFGTMGDHMFLQWIVYPNKLKRILQMIELDILSYEGKTLLKNFAIDPSNGFNDNDEDRPHFPFRIRKHFPLKLHEDAIANIKAM